MCHMCNEPGHFSKECPNKDRCNTCNESGHYSKDCPNKYSAVICRYCRESGHYKNECPVNPKIQDKKGMLVHYENFPIEYTEYLQSSFQL